MQYLADWDITQKPAEKVLAGLKFIGVLNRDGTPNKDRWNRLTHPGDYQSALQECVREAYALLFSSLVDIATTPKEEIKSVLAKTWEVGVGSRVGALGFFCGICKESGIEIGGEDRSSGREAPSRETKADGGRRAEARKRVPNEKPALGNAGRVAHSSGPVLSFTLQLTGREEESDLEEFFAKVKRAYDKTFG